MAKGWLRTLDLDGMARLYVTLACPYPLSKIDGSKGVSESGFRTDRRWATNLGGGYCSTCCGFWRQKMGKILRKMRLGWLRLLVFDR